MSYLPFPGYYAKNRFIASPVGHFAVAGWRLKSDLTIVEISLAGEHFM